MEHNYDNKEVAKVYFLNQEIIFDPKNHKFICIKNGFSLQEVNINIPASRCLELLIISRGKVITRENFLKQVWTENGVFVSQNTYYQNISILRKALKKAGFDEEIIVTIPHRGLTLNPNIVIEQKDANDAYYYSISKQRVDLSNTQAPAGKEIAIEESSKLIGNKYPLGTKNKVDSHPRWNIIILIVFILILISDTIIMHLDSTLISNNICSIDKRASNYTTAEN